MALAGEARRKVSRAAPPPPPMLRFREALEEKMKELCLVSEAWSWRRDEGLREGAAQPPCWACLQAQCAPTPLLLCQGGLQSSAGLGGVEDLASRCESLLVHIFLPLQCWQFQKGGSNVEKEVPVTILLVSTPPCPVLPTPFSPPRSWA